ncbi:aldehyde dehydrogenase family protein [Aestuariispira insulae]|uniref:Aldehyde dehydrogenase (NAD+)/betaine-aldehyde dehydrogenase n=1 Tax=Aestuariispira insulae TaxID=1461337 RepID=A0A3D9H441_9PROT|nr:aldehyde dehydrogenase family protein [Aestuariispira insulae]RED44274.1 aldehyde dehydrogenase (NAD+)/betaine-aldehyde dehydrogenase [Aestuariispira insulae]
MSDLLNRLRAEALETGRIEGLPGDMFINGQWRAAATGNRMETLDPGTGEAFAEFAAGGAAEVEEAVAGSDKAFKEVWRKAAPVERANILRRAARLMRENEERLAVVETLDSGKTVSEALGDVRGSARLLDYYAGAADKLQGDTIPLGPDYMSWTMIEPVGVTAHIIPWNYPTSTMIRGIAPALAAGCTAVVKPAETTPLTALMIAELFQKAGLPNGVLNVVTGTGVEAGAPLVSDPRVRHITFTGSVGTGSRVMEAAAKNIASVTLELGGKSPAIVLADCDLDRTVEDMIWAIYSNAGQICSAGSRLVIERSIHAEFLEKLAKRADELTVGHGLRQPDVGAINSAMQLDKIAGYVEDARSRGVTVAAGGERATDLESGKGWFFRPTILDNVEHQDRVIQEEIFGPVLSVQVTDGVEQALEYANGTDFGLAAAIYTADITKALRLARDIDAGQLYINEYYAGGVEVPFGGNKLSGFGREKGLAGLEAYCKIKAVTARI